MLRCCQTSDLSSHLVMAQSNTDYVVNVTYFAAKSSVHIASLQVQGCCHHLVMTALCSCCASDIDTVFLTDVAQSVLQYEMLMYKMLQYGMLL